MDLFTLVAKMQLDSSDYEKKVSDIIQNAKEAGVEINKGLSGSGTSGTGGGVGKAVDQAEKGVSSFGTTVKSILASQLIQKSVSVIADVGKQSVQTASDLVEVQNVIDTTFGSSAAKIDRWAQSQAQNYGLSELQAKQFAGYYGSMLQTSGIGQAEAAEMAMQLSERAGDFASYRNLKIEDAYQKILSGMAGEREPLLRYGLDMGADAVGEYAGEKLSEMPNDERYLARYQYLMEKTLPMQGDYARTENELANSTRTLGNNASRFLSSMGEKLLPILKAGTNAANDLFDALYAESAEKSLSGIDAAMAETEAGIENSAQAARTMADVLKDYGDRSALTVEQQKQWDAVAGELLRTIPELGDQINMQTGEIEGGTDALMENIAAWEDAGKASAQTSALEAKREMLAGISDEIAKEQGLLAIAEKEIAQHADDASGVGAAIAQRLGVEFDGTAESFREMMNSVSAYAAAEALGFTDEEIASTLSGYDQASQEAKKHKEAIASLQSEYDTVQAGIDTSTASMQESVGSLETSVSESFGSIGAATTTLIASFDQSDSAYANAFSTGMGAANGLTAAYPAYAAAASLYSSSGLGGGTGPSVHLPGHATGLDYVPYDDYVARLHEGEAVLTKSEAATWRSDGPGMASAQEIASAVAQAVAPLYEAISNISIVMDHRAVGHAVTRTVSENIATEARALRYCL